MFTASFNHLIWQGTWETTLMVFVASAFGILFGLCLGVVLLITRSDHIAPHPLLNKLLGLLVNIVRSVPFIIFLIAVVPFTKRLVGSTIGLGAAMVPLSLAAIPFYARIAEAALEKVPAGLIDAALSMGASHGQLIVKVLIPEALPGLIQGGTLTVISLIGYSAMAGAVGGGGLGQLAIEYGYQRFDVAMMITTVAILVVMVQLIQWWGDYLSQTRRLKQLAMFCLLMGLFSSFHLLPHAEPSNARLTIGITGGPQEEIMTVAKRVAKQQYHLDLESIVFSDYVLPNQAVAAGDIDANIFQHIPYLEAQKQLHHYPLTWIAKTFVYPMGFYSQQIKQLKQLRSGSLVAIPNDPSNEGRALHLLAACHVIRLNRQAGLLATPEMIEANPYGLRFKTIDAAQVPRVLDSVALAGITNDYLGVTGLSADQALCREGNDVPYANVIVVRTDQKDRPLFKQLIAIMHSPEVVKATQRLFPKGAAIQAW